ncbi:hypothetical protein C0J08_10935 [Marinomonas sp. CT5]|uniref:GNAT family N-acetyltransferase n=1 Tax=Marinomonas sp. CT5 TaxID=2066133 RepID=UPI001798CB8B|nr:GNAT family N-acetyltransferase [Marinomonas sp. CT5]NVK73062.1 GNAT family N-acetyltransferase [Oceanospirillaceae bacterium]QUX95900.1 hypothetical protein C0J08_10935 [Marinomonas sp. CT5]
MIRSLTIRQAKEDDLKSILLFEFRNKGWFSEFLPQQTLYKQTEVYFKRLLRSKFKHMQYLVYLPNNILIGRFSAQLLDNNAASLEVSYRVAKNFVNQGIARFVLRRLLLIWASFGVKEVYANVAEHNRASIKVLLSCGFEIEEIQKDAIKLGNVIHDSLLFRWSITEGTFYKVMRHDKMPTC